MYSEYKLNKQGDNIQPWCTHFPILRQHLSSLNQSWLKGKEVKVTGKKAEEFALQSYREVVAKGRWSLFCFNHYVPYMVHRSCLAGGVWPCGLIHSVSPLSSHGSLHVAGALMALKCLTHAHTILDGLVLSRKENKRETLTHSGSSCWGAVSSGAFGTHQGVTLARVPQLLPQHLPIGRGSLWERRSEDMGKRPQGPHTGHQKCRGLGVGCKRISIHETEWKNKVH